MSRTHHASPATAGVYISPITGKPTDPKELVDLYYWPIRGSMVGWRPKEPQGLAITRKVAEGWAMLLRVSGSIDLKIVPTKKREKS